MNYLKSSLKWGIAATVALSSTQAAVFQSGEIDFGVVLTDTDEFEFEAHVVNGVVDGSPVVDQEFEVSDIQVLVTADVRGISGFNVPQAGLMMGDPVWVLPQSEVPAVPYVALASEELSGSDWSTPIIFRMVNAISPSGNGTFSMFTTDSGGAPTFHFSSVGDGSTADSNQFTSNFAHDHVNWAFTEPGTWTVEVEAFGTHNALGALSTTETMTFQVVPEPSSSALVLLGASTLLLRRRVA